MDKWYTAEFPEGPTWAEAKGVVPPMNGWMDCREWHPERWGTFRRHEMGWRRQQGGFNLFPLVDFHPGFMTASGFGGDLVARVRGLHLQHGRGAGRLPQVGALRPAAVQGDDDRFPIYHEPTDRRWRSRAYDAALVDQADEQLYMNHGCEDTLKAMPDNIFLTTGALQPTYFHLRASPAALVPRAVALSPASR